MGYAYKTNAKRQHEKSAASGSMFKPVVCKKRMYGKPCEHCNKVAKLAQSDDEDDKTIASKCRAKSTYYMNIVDMLGKKINQVYGSGITNWKDLIENLPDDEGEVVDFTDPDKAYPILLTRKGKGRNTKYTLRISNKAIQIPAKYLTGMHQLHNVVDIIAKNDDMNWTPGEGKNKFLVLPPWGKEADGDFFYEVFYHWSLDLLGATEDDGFGDDETDEFGDDAGGDESFSDDFGDDEKAEGGDDDFGDDAPDETDDFEAGGDDAEAKPDLDGMDKDALIKVAGLKGVKLSDKALAASADQIRTYLKKKFEDIPW